MAGTAGRIERGIIGLAILAWGYSHYAFPENIILMIVGMLVIFAAAGNWSMLAPLFGYPFNGGDIIAKYGELNGLPGEDNTVKYPPADRYGSRPGSTTQGGSNYGQGSMHLGGNIYRQGSEKTRGSNYGNEREFNEA